MPKCTVCTHDKRNEIEHALLSGGIQRDLAARYGLSETALSRHKLDHIRALVRQAEHNHLVRAAVAASLPAFNHYVDLQAEMARLFLRLNKLFDACDRSLADAHDPDLYDLGPRAGEIQVTYEQEEAANDNQPGTGRKKAPLSHLLLEAERGLGVKVLAARHHSPDPRETLLKTAEAIRRLVETCAKLTGAFSLQPQAPAREDLPPAPLVEPDREYALETLAQAKHQFQLDDAQAREFLRDHLPTVFRHLPPAGD